jgi:eukaryotic-like serine/threonine-protein kinase
VLSPQERLGPYRLIRRVGAGGMGQVFQATDERTGADVALKLLLPHIAAEPDLLLRFKREFRALVRLNHPNVVRVFDAGIERDVPFMVMEYVIGSSLRAYFDQNRGNTNFWAVARTCLVQILEALAHIHTRRVIHRDLKPENLLVTSEGQVKLMDFGVARTLWRPTRPSGLLGTFAYMAPEQIRGDEVDARSDLYAVGALMFEMVNGGPPFPVEPVAAALHHHLHTIPAPLLALNPEADPKISALLGALLEKEPNHRPASARQALEMLGAVEPAPRGGTDIQETFFSPRWVGREDETKILQGLRSRTASGGGEWCVLEGPSGIGKSRLLQHAFSERQSAVIFTGWCARDSVTTYSALGGILAAMDRELQRMSPETAFRVLQKDGPWVRRFSLSLAQRGPHAPTDLEKVPAHERRGKLHKAIIGIIGRFALVRPTVLVIEDAHWADDGTLLWLFDLCRTLLASARRQDGRAVCPLSLVMTRRPPEPGSERLDRLLEEVRKHMPVTNLLLEGLTVDLTGELMASMSGAGRWPAGIVETVHRRSFGRPLWVEATLRAWAKEGQIVRSDGVWALRSSGEAGGQNSRGERPLTKMLDGASGLGANAKRLLEYVALMGVSAEGVLLRALDTGGEATFLDALDELVRNGILIEHREAGGQIRYRTYHDRFRELVFRGISEGRRATMHLDVAHALERTWSFRRREIAERLARHFTAGGLPVRALRYLQIAADRASEEGDLSRALRLITEARAVAERLEKVLANGNRLHRVLCAEIELLTEFGRLDEAIELSCYRRSHPVRSESFAQEEILRRRSYAERDKRRLLTWLAE